jgi:hypothetical protein
MDTTWITQPRNTPEYAKGLNGFLDFAFKNRRNGMAKCPCKKCGFKTPQSRSVMYDHLRATPFPVGYTDWCYHGEVAIGENSNGSSSNPTNAVHDSTTNEEDPIQNMLNDAFGVDRNPANEVPIASNVDIEIDEDVTPDATQERNEAKEFYELAKDGEQPLYEGCKKYSKLAFLVKLYHIKCLCGMSDKSMTMILELLQDAFEHAKIPSSFYEAKKTITKLGLNYVKIPACPKDCMLYWGNKEDEERETCKVCHTSRWKSSIKSKERETGNDDNSLKKIPAKVLRYFPLKPRLQRLFLSSKTSEDMRWHALSNNSDEMMRHPRDSEAWKRFDSTHPWFASDARNVRLALATDGFNPFGVMSSNYSVWPVILITCNT